MFKQYIQSGIITAKPMANHTYQIVINNKEKGTGKKEDGFLIISHGGIRSWLPRYVFELTHREISLEEKQMVK